MQKRPANGLRRVGLKKVGPDGICTRYHGSVCDGIRSKVGRKAKLSGTAEFSVSGKFVWGGFLSEHDAAI